NDGAPILRVRYPFALEDCRGDKAMTEPNAPNPNTPNGSSPASDAAQNAAATDDGATTVLDDLEMLRVRAQERDQFLPLLQRTQADFENYQKRNQREREQERRYRNEGLGRDLLPVIDNLERALESARKVNETGPLVQGVNLVLTQFLDLLKRHGITPIEAQGQ